MLAVRWLAVPLALHFLACGDDGTSDDSSHGSGANGSGAGSSSGGSGSSSGGGGNGHGGGSSSGASGTGASGTGGGLPECVTDTVTLAVQGQNFECDFVIPPEYDDNLVNFVLETGGGVQPLCWRASSQGCDDLGSTGGWWFSGDGVLLCDSTCTTLIETPGTKLHLWVGCPSDPCF